MITLRSSGYKPPNIHWHLKTGGSDYEITFPHSGMCVYMCDISSASAEPHLKKVRLWGSHWPHQEDSEKPTLINFNAIECLALFFFLRHLGDRSLGG